jgi:hypothetical protein
LKAEILFPVVAVPKPKFIADADLNQDVIDGVLRRSPDCDFLNADEGGTRGLDDPSILRLAPATDRIVVSHDRNTMTAHFYRFLEQSPSPGLIIVRQSLDFGEVVEQIVLFSEASDADELRGFITWLPLNARG